MARRSGCSGWRPGRVLGAMALLAGLGMVAGEARTQEIEPERCPRLIAWEAPRVMPAAFRLVQADTKRRARSVSPSSGTRPS